MPRKRKPRNRNKLPAPLIFAGIALIIAAAVFLKRSGDSPAASVSLEAQLDQALQESKPTFVFLHSMDCIPCKEMMDVVAEVYPRFEDRVVLIDVDVYDQGNTNILRSEGLQAIPTLVFYDRHGTRQMHVGVLQPQEFRAVLTSISGAN
jgi:thiol:disulfide interchange protein